MLVWPQQVNRAAASLAEMAVGPCKIPRGHVSRRQAHSAGSSTSRENGWLWAGRHFKIPGRFLSSLPKIPRWFLSSLWQAAGSGSSQCGGSQTHGRRAGDRDMDM